MEWLSDRLKKWIERFWFIRGVALAVFTLHIVDGIVQLERYEILRGVYAAIVGWDRVAAGIGQLIGRLPILPTLDHFTVTAFVYSFIIGTPSAYVIITRPKDFFQTDPHTDKGGSTKGVRGAFISGLTIPREIIEFTTRTKLRRRIILSLMAFTALFIPGFLYYTIATDQIVNEQNQGSLVAMLAAIFVLGQMFFISLLYVMIALMTVRGLAKGYFIALSFLATFVLLYWIGGPEFRDSVNVFSDTVIEGR